MQISRLEQMEEDDGDELDVKTSVAALNQLRKRDVIQVLTDRHNA